MAGIMAPGRLQSTGACPQSGRVGTIPHRVQHLSATVRHRPPFCQAAAGLDGDHKIAHSRGTGVGLRRRRAVLGRTVPGLRHAGQNLQCPLA